MGSKTPVLFFSRPSRPCPVQSFCYQFLGRAGGTYLNNRLPVACHLRRSGQVCEFCPIWTHGLQTRQFSTSSYTIRGAGTDSKARSCYHRLSVAKSTLSGRWDIYPNGQFCKYHPWNIALISKSTNREVWVHLERCQAVLYLLCT